MLALFAMLEKTSTTSVPVSLFIDSTLRNSNSIFDLAKENVLQFAPNVTLEQIVYNSGECQRSETDTKDIFSYFQNYHSKNYRITMGPTCVNNFLRFSNLTGELKALQINVLSGYPYEHPSMIDMVTRSPQNVAENLVAVLRGFDWAQIGIVICKECYADDELASEGHLEVMLDVFEESNMAVKHILEIGKGVTRENISNEITVFEPTARVILMMLGNNLNDYLEFIEVMSLNNYTREEYTPVVVLSKSTLNGLTVDDHPDLKNILDGSIIIFNNVYQSPEVTEFSSKFSFSSIDEQIISLQMYEGYHLLGHYLSTASVSDPFNYIQPEMTIAEMRVDGPFGEIFINNAGQRIAGFEVAVYHQETLLSLGTVSTDKKCSRLACLHFDLNPNITKTYNVPKDVPLCGFHGEICDQTGVFYAVLVVLAVVSLFVIAYIVFRKIIVSNRGRSISNPWLIPFSEINFIDLTNTEGSQHMSIQSLQRNTNEKARLQSLARNKQIATVDQSYVLADKFVIRDKPRFDKTDANILYQLKSHLQHDNLNGFVGLSFDKSTHIFIIWAQCFRGSLHDHIFTKEHNRGTANNFEGAFLRDILKGVEYLHSSPLGYHGNLTLHNCLLDSHWIVKLSGFGVNRFLVKWKSMGQIFTEDHTPIIKSEELHYFDPSIKKIWKTMTGAKSDGQLITPQMGRKADMYSFGVILYEIMFKKKLIEPIYDIPKGSVKSTSDSHLVEGSGEEEVVLIDEENDQKASKYPLPIAVPEEIEIHPDLVKMLENCFGSNRPDVSLARKITDTVLKMQGSLVDLMIKNLTAYTQGLAETVELRTKELTIEMEKNDQLLMELLPREIAVKLRSGFVVLATKYESATILYSDIVGFTSLCSESQPIEVVTLLQGMYERFDLIISQQGGYKMETIGDAYCVAAGLPTASKHEHVKQISMIALLQRDSLHAFEIPHRPGKYLNCRWGFNTGEVFSGVIGYRAPRYACFGEAVSLASKMESNGKEDRIQLTLESQMMLEDNYKQFTMSPRGGVNIEGYGHVLTYWLEGVNEKMMEEVRENLHNVTEELENRTKNRTGSTPGASQSGSAGGEERNKEKERPKDKMTLAKEKVLAERQREEQRMLQSQTIHEALDDTEEQLELKEVLVDGEDEHDPRSTLSSPMLSEDIDGGEEEDEVEEGGTKKRQVDSQASTIPDT